MEEFIKLFDAGDLCPADAGPVSAEEAARVHIDPDQLETVLTQITLEKGELVPETDHYATLWNMFFVNRGWFYHNNNGHKLAELFPAFAVVEMPNPYQSPGPEATPELKEKFAAIAELFNSCYLVLPFKTVKARKYYGRVLEVAFIGVKFNQFDVSRRNYRVRHHQVRVHAVCAYGYFQHMRQGNAGYATSLAALRGAYVYLDTLGNPRTGGSSMKDTRILNVFQAVEDALLLEDMATTPAYRAA